MVYFFFFGKHDINISSITLKFNSVQQTHKPENQQQGIGHQMIKQKSGGLNGSLVFNLRLHLKHKVSCNLQNRLGIVSLGHFCKKEV